MKSLEEFKNYYEVYMVPQLRMLEEKRKSLYSRMRIIDTFILVFILGAGISLVIYVPQAICHAIIFGLFIGFGLSALNRWIHVKSSGYYDEFKRLVMGNVIAFLGESFSYNPAGFIDKVEFMQSGIFKNKPHPSGYHGDDFVSGNIGDARLSFSELRATYTTGSGKHRHTHTIFKGLFFVAHFPGRFKDNIIMNMNQGGFSGGYFPSNSLETLGDMGNKQVSVSFQGNKMFIAISFTEDLFEPKMDRSLLDYYAIGDYYRYLKFAFETVEGLIRNSGIWSPGEQAAMPPQPQQIPYGISREHQQVPVRGPLEQQPSARGEQYADSSFYEGLCPSCSSPITEQTAFCINCGYKL